MLKCENLPRTNATKYKTQNILVKFQQNEHTPGLKTSLYNFFTSWSRNYFIFYIFVLDDVGEFLSFNMWRSQLGEARGWTIRY